jgi:hypothetical protein
MNCQKAACSELGILAGKRITVYKKLLTIKYGISFCQDGRNQTPNFYWLADVTKK